MKPSLLYQSLTCFMLANFGQASPTGPGPVELDAAVRAAYPGRLWTADYNGTVPNTTTKWVLTNDFGTLPEYWIAEDDADAASAGLSSAVEKLDGRAMTEWAIAYWWRDCDGADQIGWVNSPSAKTCYGVWSTVQGDGRALWISTRTTQVNTYTDPACASFSFAIRNYAGCKKNIRICSIWMEG